MTAARFWGRLGLLLLAMTNVAAAAEPTLLDDFEDISGWTASASEGTKVWILQEPGVHGMALRVGWDLNSAGGYVLVRKTFSVPLPDNYAFTFALRGDARPNNFEFKLVDPSGKNVWWRKQADFAFPKDWEKVAILKSRIGFAWGPSGGRTPLKQVGAIEFAVSAGQGGTGSIWIDDLAIEPREPVGRDGMPPEVRSSTSVPGHAPELMLDDDPATTWKSEPLPADQWVVVDLGRNAEYGGLVIDWDPDDYATVYAVQVSNDGYEWNTVHTTATGHGGRHYIYMPDAESRFIRLDMRQSSRGQGYAIAQLVVKPFEFSASPNDFFRAIAADAPPGAYPKYLAGRQTYWTIVGVESDDHEALLNEEGMLEVDKGAFSIEPFLWVDGKLVTWNDVQPEQQLEDGYLPIPSVVWRHDGLVLTVTAFAGGEPDASRVYARYRLENHGARAETVQLYLAIRPFQVNPPWQSLNMNGGVTRIQDIAFDGRVVRVNRDRAVVSLTMADAFGAATFDEGSITDFLLAGKLPRRSQVNDTFGFASAALGYTIRLDPGAHDEVDLVVPFREPYVAAAAALDARDSRAFVAAEHEVMRRHWQTILNRVDVDLPPEGAKLVDTLRSTIAYILINRDGPALRPGSRDYARSWIRDGAMTSAALLETGFTQEVPEFLRWYVRYQAPDGRVPCCVDARGADPVSENDSGGELVWAVAEYYRYTHDVGFLHDMWPRVVAAVEYLDALRKRRMTDEYRTGDKAVFYGLLPESISHEGYAAHPVHSYWDDFFALRGFKDAAELAAIVGDDERAARYAALRDDFRGTLLASIARTMTTHGIDYIPGSADLGDFDPTSTSIAIAPVDELAHLPAAAVARTFDSYWADFTRRRSGEADWEAYTPYELRNVETFVRLGQKDRALELLAWLVDDQRPPAWNAWAEVAYRDKSAPHFFGDMPHTWVGSGFIRSFRSLLAYEREADDALVVGAGIPSGWVTNARGVSVRRLPTHWGILNFTMRADGPDAVRVQLAGDLVVPPGRIVVASPLDRPIVRATVDGVPAEVPDPGHALVARVPADVVLRY